MNGIINTGHLADIPGVVHSEEQAAAVNQESFTDDDTLDSLPSVPKDDMEILTEQAIRLLDAYVYRDPVIDLTEIYQQKGVQDIDVYFQERPLQDDNNRGRHRYWAYTFECPLRGTFYHSSLPLPLFTNEPPSLDLVVQLSQKVLGHYDIFDEGVYFTSRKHAKRSAALAALEALAGSTDGVMYPSLNEASSRLSQILPKSIVNSKKYFPSWVHELCRLGISSKTIKISYQEQLVQVGWKGQPTMLCCVVSITKPVELTAVGLPCQSKAEALDSAVALLVEEVNRQLPGFVENFNNVPTNQEMTDMRSCDPSDGSYVYPIPTWASAAFPPSEDEGSPCLYEIEFRSSQRGVRADVVLGLVFPSDPEPTESNAVIEAQFKRVDKHGKETITVRLQKQQVLDFSQLTPTEIDERFRWMKQYNEVATLNDKGNRVKDIENGHGHSGASERSCLFVPVVQSRLGTKSPSTIDWKTLKRLDEERKSPSASKAPSNSMSSRVRDIVVLGFALICLAAPSVPVAAFNYLSGGDFRPEFGVSSWYNAVGFLLLLQIFYVVIVRLRSQSPHPSAREATMMKHATLFMPLLERELEAAQFTYHLCNMASRINSDGAEATGGTYDCSSTLPSLINEATSLIPRSMYQRLEFLGDAVLGFFLGINLVGMNSSLDWDSDDLSRILSASANNRVLQDAALRSGISRLLLAHRQKSPVFLLPSKNKRKSSRQGGVVQALLSIKGQPTSSVTDKVLSDVVESLLGVAYLDGKCSDSDPSGGRMVIALLERFRLPLPEQDTLSSLPFFQAIGPCLKTGYPFNQHKAWRRQLVQIGTTLYCEHDIINRLETGWLKLMGNLFRVSSFDAHRILMEKQKAKILLLCSLFNDNLTNIPGARPFRRVSSSLTSASASTVETDTSSAGDSADATEAGLVSIALLRDTLFMIGHSSLHLAITDELFHRYPEANEGTLSLQRICATSDDVLAYIMVKSRFHESTYNQMTRQGKRFIAEMKAAESIGKKIWKRRGGWILKGGEMEFNKRRTTLSFPLPEGPPRYCGLAGGRVYGHKSKLPDGMTEDLVFSMKAIVGTLVLSLGLDGMWQCLGPLFGELLLLSADELRKEYRKDSSICK